MQESKIKQEILNQWETLELGMKLKGTQLENKIGGLQNTIDAIGFLSLFNLLILMLYIVTSLKIT